MSRLPQVTAREVIAALKRAGFQVRRIRGGHHFMQHRDDPSRETVVALHSADVPQGTLLDILKQAGLSRADFLRLL